MRLLGPELIFCAVCCVACSRPTLDELGDDDAGALAPPTDADTGVPLIEPPDAQIVAPPGNDGGSNVPPPRTDASTPVTVVDSGTPKSDAGDQLPPVLANCQSSVPNNVSLGPAIVAEVSLNGTTGTTARVKPGESVAVSVSLSYSSCGAIYSTQSLYLGVDDGSDASCRFAACSEAVPGALTIPFNFTVTAPATEGFYNVLAGMKSIVCMGSGGTSVADTPIATLCVAK